MGVLDCSNPYAFVLVYTFTIVGILRNIVGDRTDETGDAEESSQERKYAILLNAGPEEASSAANASNYAIELDDAGYEVELFLDGTTA
jgi:hypothetical protein